MSGTTCNVPLPPDLCAMVGGYVEVFLRRADDSGVKAITIFVPPNLVHTASNRINLLQYKEYITYSLERCMPEPAAYDTNFGAVVSCIVSDVLEDYGSTPAVLIVGRISLTGYHFGFEES